MTCRSWIAPACVEQVEQQRRRDVVGQVADDAQRAAARGASAAKSNSSASASCSVKPCAAVNRCAQQPRPGRDRSRWRRACRRVRSSSGSVSAPRPGPISTRWSPRLRGERRRRCVRCTRGSCRKCWPKRLRGGGRHGRRAQRRCAASRLARLHGGGEAARIGAAGAGEIERRAVIDRGAHERQAERDVDRRAEAGVLEHRQALVVVHREHGVEAAQHAAARTRCRPAAGRVTSMPALRSRAIAGAITSISSRPRWPPSPACGLRPQHGDARRGDAEPCAAGRRRGW